MTTPADMGWFLFVLPFLIADNRRLSFLFSDCGDMNDVTYFNDCITIILSSWQTFTTT